MITSKWPGLWIEGDKVTKEQAEEIILRTTNWYLSSNNKKYIEDVYKFIGIYSAGNNFTPIDFNKLEKFSKKNKVLQLNYLENTQIASRLIGGPHGWCDWNGNIGCKTYNIGKWPSIEEVIEEAKIIAEAFPFLNMTIRLLSDEWSFLDKTWEEHKELFVTDEIKIHHGNVTLIEPPSPYTIPKYKDIGIGILSDQNKEIGISKEDLFDILIKKGWFKNDRRS